MSTLITDPEILAFIAEVEGLYPSDTASLDVAGQRRACPAQPRQGLPGLGPQTGWRMIGQGGYAGPSPDSGEPRP